MESSDVERSNLETGRVVAADAAQGGEGPSDRVMSGVAQPSTRCCDSECLTRYRPKTHSHAIVELPGDIWAMLPKMCANFRFAFWIAPTRFAHIYADHAIVAAQSACELACEQAVHACLDARGVDYLRESLHDLLSSYNLTAHRTRHLYNALATDAVHKLPFWDQYTELVKLRNRIVRRAADHPTYSADQWQAAWASDKVAVPAVE